MEKEKSIYKLPEGWVWTTIGEIGIVYSGGTLYTRNPSAGADMQSGVFGRCFWVRSMVIFVERIQDAGSRRCVAP